MNILPQALIFLPMLMPLQAAAQRAVGLSVTAEEPVIYIGKSSPETRLHFFTVRYRGKEGTQGFFNVGGDAVRPLFFSRNRNLLQIDRFGTECRFIRPGQAVITVKLGAESAVVSVKIVELPFRNTSSSEEVLATLGFPDEKRLIEVFWPEVKGFDGEVYGAPPGSAVRLEHWFYKGYPGLVLAVDNGKVVKICTHRLLTGRSY
ncbi:MAG: hypothetical protein HUU20_13800 [Pirellulales bacterium]|nr:hypothetical protein [Pirellulales bacterium]